MAEQNAFQINRDDNVVTALTEIRAGHIRLVGETIQEQVEAAGDIPKGHKIALRDMEAGTLIIKYGVAIGISTAAIPKGSWVHLHVMKSLYDQRSSHLDTVTGVPHDIQYE